jgi:ribulose-5-phosphate 4-epimerase/fuculose-1-phosphate aldolase
MNRKQCVKDFINTCHLIQELKLVSGTGGNVSIRFEDQMWITPSGMALSDISEDTISKLSLQDGHSLNSFKPSKEHIMHRLCYLERSDINAVIHVHSVYSIAIASIAEFISQGIVPAYTPGYGMRIGAIPVIPYMEPGSIGLANSVARIIKERNSTLLANHGVVTVGSKLEDALNLIEEIEENSEIYFITNGKAVALTVEQINALSKRYSTKQ